MIWQADSAGKVGLSAAFCAGRLYVEVAVSPHSLVLVSLVSLAAGVSVAAAQVTLVPSPGQGAAPGAAPAAAMAPPADRAQVGPWADRFFTRLDTDQNDALTGGELMVLTQGGVAAMGGGRLRAMISQSDT